MRQLLPSRLYPGWRRVGASLTELATDPRVTKLDGVDWYWLPSLLRAFLLMIRSRPEVVIFQWWTGTVVHSYIALALLARMMRSRVIVEFHEIIETGEANIPLAHAYIRNVAPILMRLATGFAVHSAHDQSLVLQHWRVGSRRPMVVLPHGPHDHYQAADAPAVRMPPEHVCNILFFGVIRPYKGLEHLIRAFESIPVEDIDHYWLTVVGETWEGWTLPTDMIERSPRKDRITLVNRYVSDEELHGHLKGADAVVLPYLRSSLSGPLHVAMGYGLPIVITDVGGNVEAAQGYAGIVVVPPGDHEQLATALTRLRTMSGSPYKHPHTWAQTAAAYDAVF
jgi:glycosyltransferase involved in cell wall biosynthesis